MIVPQIIHSFDAFAHAKRNRFSSFSPAVVCDTIAWIRVHFIVIIILFISMVLTSMQTLYILRMWGWFLREGKSGCYDCHCNKLNINSCIFHMNFVWSIFIHSERTAAKVQCTFFESILCGIFLGGELQKKKYCTMFLNRWIVLCIEQSVPLESRLVIPICFNH